VGWCPKPAAPGGREGKEGSEGPSVERRLGPWSSTPHAVTRFEHTLLRITIRLLPTDLVEVARAVDVERAEDLVQVGVRRRAQLRARLVGDGPAELADVLARLARLPRGLARRPGPNREQASSVSGWGALDREQVREIEHTRK
jgi:hypothetical protein